MRIEGLRDIVALEMWCVSRSDRPRALAEWPTMLGIDKAHYYHLTAVLCVVPAAAGNGSVTLTHWQQGYNICRDDFLRRSVRIAP